MRSTLSKFSLLALLSLTLIAAGPRRMVIEIYVYDFGNWDYIQNATITVTYAGGSAVYVMGHPETHGRFILPASVNSIDVTIEQPGYCTLEETILLDGKPHVGGQAYYFGLSSCE